jgi:hypothetical protein
VPPATILQDAIYQLQLSTMVSEEEIVLARSHDSLDVLNAWEWFHDVALGRTVAAVTDAVFVLIALCVIIASFFGRKGAIQG